MRRPNARELYDFPRLVFPNGWAVHHRQDIDPEAVSYRPPFGHRFVDVWPDIQCVPITNADGSDNLFGRNRAVTVDTIAVKKHVYHVARQLQMLKARSAGQKRPREAPGYSRNRDFNDLFASHGDVAGEATKEQPRNHRRVTFARPEKTEEINEYNPIPSEETVNSEWGVDGVDFVHPSIEHHERFTWRLTPSRRSINLTAGRHREFYDLDLLAFQAGSYASDKEKTEYLETDIDGNLIKGVQLELPEDDYIPAEKPDDGPIEVYATATYAEACLSNRPDCELTVLPSRRSSITSV